MDSRLSTHALREMQKAVLGRWNSPSLLLSEGILKALKREKTSSQKYTVIAL
jgi:hypothetical protein